MLWAFSHVLRLFSSCEKICALNHVDFSGSTCDSALFWSMTRNSGSNFQTVTRNYGPNFLLKIACPYHFDRYSIYFLVNSGMQYSVPNIFQVQIQVYTESYRVCKT